MLPRTAFYDAHLAAAHEELRNHPIARAHLGASYFKVDGEFETFDTRFPLTALDLELEGEEFAHLFGVFDASRVHMQNEGNEGDPLHPAGFYVTVINGRLLSGKNKTAIVKLEGQGASLHLPTFLFLDQFFLAGNAPRQLGSVTFMLCAITAHLCGFEYIELVAAGGVGFNERHIGYKFWPDVGFDALLEPGEPRPVADASTVLDIVEYDRDWWIEHGSQRLMKFDLSADSRSWSKLLSYGRTKGLIT